MMKQKIVLGFSGGLDTSFCVKYLADELNYEVHSVTVNTGGFSVLELKNIEAHAYHLGVASHATIDAREDYYNSIIRYLIFGNVLKNDTYPLSVSAERVVQAMKIAEHVKKKNADAVAHGSTGAGNDQVRFDMIFHIMIPDAKILTPVRDLKLSRAQEINFLKERDVQMNFEKAEYSINKGLWGTSIGGKETLNSNGWIPEEAWPTQLTANEPAEITLHFAKGELSGVNDKRFENRVEAIEFLQDVASPYAIGRDIHVGDTIIGIKGRVGFEAAAPMLIIKAHQALEKHVLSKSQIMIKKQLSEFYGNWVHEGQLLDPVICDIESYFRSSQERVTGSVFLRLMPYRFLVLGIDSPNDLMNPSFGSYGEMNKAWSGEDVRGFSKIFGNQASIVHTIKKLQDEKKN